MSIFWMEDLTNGLYELSVWKQESTLIDILRCLGFEIGKKQFLGSLFELINECFRDTGYFLKTERDVLKGIDTFSIYKTNVFDCIAIANLKSISREDRNDYAVMISKILFRKIGYQSVLCIKIDEQFAFAGYLRKAADKEIIILSDWFGYGISNEKVRELAFISTNLYTYIDYLYGIARPYDRYPASQDYLTLEGEIIFKSDSNVPEWDGDWPDYKMTLEYNKKNRENKYDDYYCVIETDSYIDYDEEVEDTNEELTWLLLEMQLDEDETDESVSVYESGESSILQYAEKKNLSNDVPRTKLNPFQMLNIIKESK